MHFWNNMMGTDDGKLWQLPSKTIEQRLQEDAAADSAVDFQIKRNHNCYWKLYCRRNILSFFVYNTVQHKDVMYNEPIDKS